MRSNIYTQARHTLVVDGIPVVGFAEGDHIQVKMDGAAAARTQGGDGPAMNVSVDQGGQLTIGINPTSPVLGLLYGTRDAQKATPRLFSVVLMSGVEEIISASGCAFGDLPQFSTGGPTMQPRQFVLECLKIKMDTSGVEALAGGFIGGIL